MTDQTPGTLGTVTAIWRYPVKSMIGEELDTGEVTRSGIWGDRVFAIRDLATGKIASAKNPKKWPDLFHFRAGFIQPPAADPGPYKVRITMPDGNSARSDVNNISELLSRVLKREVVLEEVENGRKDGGAPVQKRSQDNVEEYWPDLEGLKFKDTVTDFSLPAGTFFDAAFLHLLTTSTLECRQGLEFLRG